MISLDAISHTLHSESGLSRFSLERRRGYAQQDLPTHSTCFCAGRTQASTCPTGCSVRRTWRLHLGSPPGALAKFSAKMKHTGLGREKGTQKVLRFHCFLPRPFSAQPALLPRSWKHCPWLGPAFRMLPAVCKAERPVPQSPAGSCRSAGACCVGHATETPCPWALRGKRLPQAVWCCSYPELPWKSQVSQLYTLSCPGYIFLGPVLPPLSPLTW